MQKHAKDKKNKMQINICQQMPGMLNQQLFTANWSTKDSIRADGQVRPHTAAMALCTEKTEL